MQYWLNIITALLQLFILVQLHFAFKHEKEMVKAILEWQSLANKRITDLERLVGLLLHQAEQRPPYQKVPTSH